jgi:flagellar basal-body rod protein FlgC
MVKRMSILSIAASGLAATEIRMAAAAENIAHADNAGSRTGGVYQRRRVALTDQVGGGVTAQTQTDTSTGPISYDPTHPAADDQGLIEYPNVDLVTETVDSMLAQKAYSINLALFRAGDWLTAELLDVMPSGSAPGH